MTQDTTESPESVSFYFGWQGQMLLVTLTADDPCAEFGHSEETEEGWASEYVSFTYEPGDGVVWRKWDDSSRDCDGPHSTSGEDLCHVRRLASVQPYTPTYDPFGNVILLPEWQSVRSRVRDIYAEMAGY